MVPGPTNAGRTLDQVVPSTGPSTTATGATIDHLRLVLPAGTMIGGAAAETTTSSNHWRRTRHSS